jgi:hypothetical protein
VIHTYRDPKVLGRRFVGPPALVFVVAGVILLGPFDFRWSPADAIPSFVFLGLVVVVGVASYRREQYSDCGEIRLDDDGTCEFETKGRVTRIHVNEIKSVNYWRDSESTNEQYTIVYQGGKLLVSQRMTDFLDFLTRLKTLNPAVDLSSFPALLADARPVLGAPGATEHRSPVSRFLRSALFPLIVVSGLIWLAIDTISGQ